MPTSKLSVRSPKAERYYDSLCRHFARKVEVDRDGAAATVHFPMGPCDMASEGDTLSFRCSAPADDALVAMQEIIERHLSPRPDFRDIEFDWQTPAPG